MIERWCYERPDGTRYVLIAPTREKAEANRTAAEADGCKFVSEKPHPDDKPGRFAHRCGDEYCRCAQ